MKMFSSSGYNIVEPDGSGGLKLTPITAFVARDDDDKTVEAIPSSSNDYAPIHPGRLVMRPDGWMVTADGKVSNNTTAAIEYFANYQPSRINRQRRFPQQLLLAPLAIDENGYPYF